MSTLPLQIAEFFQDHHVMSIAASDVEGIWCASVFYHFDADVPRLLFLTSTDTRHGRMLAVDPRLAGTIAGQPVEVASIRGIQFSGTAQMLGGPEHTRALSAYLGRFPFAKSLHAPIWAVTIEHVKLTDNSLGFGHKLSWDAAPELTPVENRK